MKIRREQLNAFQEVADDAFVRRVINYVQEKHGTLTIELPSGKFLISDLSDETLSRLAHNGIIQARKYGMSWESTLTSFVLIMFMTAPNFHQHPIINRILRDESIEPNMRIDRLLEHVTGANWQAAKDIGDPQAWGLTE
jgi:hypothetical protein